MADQQTTSARVADAALKAAWELDALLESELRSVGPGFTGETPAAFAEGLRKRGTLLRMRTLAGASA